MHKLTGFENEEKNNYKSLKRDISFYSHIKE